MAEPLLVLDDVRAGYGESVVLDGILLAVPPGGSLAILGATASASRRSFSPSWARPALSAARCDRRGNGDRAWRDRAPRALGGSAEGRGDARPLYRIADRGERKRVKMGEVAHVHCALPPPLAGEGWGGG